MVLRVDLDAHLAGERIDRAVLAALTDQGVALSRSALRQAFAQGGVRAHGHVLKPGRSVADVRSVEVQLARPTVAVPEADPVPLPLVYEDDDLVVVDKPPFVVVHPGPSHERGTLVHALLHHLGCTASALPVLEGNDRRRPGVVHRIDRGTSGLVVLAKTERAATELATQFRRHTVVRTYQGFVAGEPTWTTHAVVARHGRDPRDRRRFTVVSEGGKWAKTGMRLVARFVGAAWLEFRLETGRTHQIRVHASHLGHALVGDPIYGRPPRHLEVRQLGAALGRQALHADTLGFRHPDGRELSFASPLPQDLCDLLAKLRGPGVESEAVGPEAAGPEPRDVGP